MRVKVGKNRIELNHYFLQSIVSYLCIISFSLIILNQFIINSWRKDGRVKVIISFHVCMCLCLPLRVCGMAMLKYEVSFREHFSVKEKWVKYGGKVEGTGGWHRSRGRGRLDGQVVKSGWVAWHTSFLESLGYHISWMSWSRQLSPIHSFFCLKCSFERKFMTYSIKMLLFPLCF